MIDDETRALIISLMSAVRTEERAIIADRVPADDNAASMDAYLALVRRIEALST